MAHYKQKSFSVKKCFLVNLFSCNVFCEIIYGFFYWNNKKIHVLAQIIHIQI